MGERVEKREEEIKKLIDDMITRLLEEANADAEKEGWCDTEMGKSKVTRDKLTEEIDGLDAAIVDGKATIMKLREHADFEGRQGRLGSSFRGAFDLEGVLQDQHGAR